MPTRGGYGRLLVYVFNADGQNVNIELIRQGWSEFYVKYGRGRYAAEMEAAGGVIGGPEMKGYIGLTDYDWYRQLLGDGPEEVNFWRPVSDRAFNALRPSEPFFFKLKKAHGDWIAGFGMYAGFMSLTVSDAWQYFGRSNGVVGEPQMRERIAHYVRRNRSQSVERGHRIGCIILSSPVFFPELHFVRAPDGWKQNIVTGAGYDLTRGEGQRVWAECMNRASSLRAGDHQLHHNLQLASSEVEFRERVARVRLGQGGFRAMVTHVYKGTCAVSGDHTLPALDAAHIVGVADGGPHEIGNGLLLRADIHRLYDQHLVTVTPDLQFLVSERLRTEYENGVAYYALQGHPLHLPADSELRPRSEYLESHRDHFIAAS